MEPTTYSIASMLGWESLKSGIIVMLQDALPAIILVGVSVWCATYGWTLFKAFARSYINKS